MGVVFSVRGTNGSGKTTVARWFLPPEPREPVELNWYAAPTKRDPERRKRVPGYVHQVDRVGTVGVVGPYTSACGGLDQVADFAASRGALDYMLDTLFCDFVIAEGLLSSGVYGSWGVYAADLRSRGHQYAFVYLTTPLEVCKKRIVRRQEKAGKFNKVIQWDLVEGKYNQVISNRLKALSMGELVYDLPYGHEVEALTAIMRGKGEANRVRA